MYTSAAACASAPASTQTADKSELFACFPGLYNKHSSNFPDQINLVCSLHVLHEIADCYPCFPVILAWLHGVCHKNASFVVKPEQVRALYSFPQLI